ncbi:DDE-type integrase/transposase/recombinase [Paracoccus sp. pheM1]|uniref:DDE-type integrase/transposase/recombinase n=1 Tax=Paracoccus sp. pheM1 TaxID=2831675 RepID=UPI001BDB7377|nr:DDE-type integrase/transposase/recombinase [Paracoccus sp. pheM1]MBT0780841.1 DDE-type integrase/transposase/recombinase [Paracoccus sp. pheM1]
MILDGHRWKVVGVARDDIDVEAEDGTQSSLTRDRVEEAILASRCEVVTPADAENRKALLDYTGGFERLDQLTTEQQALVRDRQLLMRALTHLEASGQKLTQRHLDHRDTVSEIRRLAHRILEDEHGYSAERARRQVADLKIMRGRTLQEDFRLYQRFDGNPVALMDRHHMKGPQGEARKKLDPFQERFIRYVLEHWLKPVQVKVASLLRMAKEAYEKTAEGWQQLSCYPSITTIRTRIKAMSATQKCIGREGIRQATNLMGAGSTDIRAVMFGERVESDEVLLSLMTNANGGVTVKTIAKKNAKDEPDKGEMFRCWLSVMLDIATRMPLAWVMSETPNADNTLELLRMAMRDKTREAAKYGCSQTPAPAVRIMTANADNGPALRNGTVRAAQLGTGSRVSDGRTYHATDKPYVESFFGPLQWDVLNFLPGYVGSRPGELPGYDPKKAAALTPDMVYGIITRYLIDEYPLRPHNGTGMFGASPKQKLEEVLRDYPTLTPPSPSERRLHLGLKKQLTVTSEGVRPFGFPYNSTALQRWADRSPEKKVNVHIDPDFPRQVSITIEGSTEVIDAQLTMTALFDLTLSEMVEVTTDAIQRRPDQCRIENQHLKDARARRTMESGFFAPANLPESWTLLERLERQSEQLLSVEIVPPGPLSPRPNLMDRGPSSTALPLAPSAQSVEPKSAAQEAPKQRVFRKIERDQS